MVIATTDGRYVLDGWRFANDGTRVREGTMFLEDGTRLYHLIDHTIPIYEFTNTLQTKALLNSKISYNIALTCINNVDHGNPLTITVPIPDGFTLDYAISNEGTYDSVTGKWTGIDFESEESND